MSEPVFGAKYVADTDRTFTVAEKKFSLSGDSFDILDQEGNKVFRADGSMLKSKAMIELQDAEDNATLCTVGKGEDGYVLKKGDSIQVMYQYKPQDDFKDSNKISSKVEIFYGTGGAYPAFFLVRIVDDKTFALMDASKNKEVARISHDMTEGKRDVWTTAVPAGLDSAFAVATTLLLDEIVE